MAPSTARAHVHTRAEELDRPEPVGHPHAHKHSMLRLVVPTYAHIWVRQPRGEGKRTPCGQDVPRAQRMASAEEHTRAAELERPDPGHLI